jgi:hypothetical protein
VLTDPAIHALDPERFKLADANLGGEGFKFFFAHVCNGICRKLRLKSNAPMIMSGRHEFRERWPSMDNTVCCSNKLCGRIVRLARAKKVGRVPGVPLVRRVLAAAALVHGRVDLRRSGATPRVRRVPVLL